jgi:hypothetical protein
VRRLPAVVLECAWGAEGRKPKARRVVSADGNDAARGRSAGGDKVERKGDEGGEEGRGVQVIVTGSAEQRAAAKAAMETIQAAAVAQQAAMQEETFPLEDGDQRRLVGPGGSTVRAMEKASGARLTMTLVDGKPAVAIRGSDEQRKRAWQLAQEVSPRPR